MTFSKCLTAAAFVAVVSASPACTDKAVDDTKRGAGDALDATRAGADKVAEKSKEVASAAGAVMTDGWITTKLKAKFADETVLDNSLFERERHYLKVLDNEPVGNEIELF